jgi:hypothetical protein
MSDPGLPLFEETAPVSEDKPKCSRKRSAR